MDKLAVLVATYNGERFIDEQMASLLSQSVMPEVVIVSDDNSTDGTWSKLELWQRRFPDIIQLHSNKTGRNGHVGNFANLCELAKETDCVYFSFSDQDDVWLEQKTQALIELCSHQESQHSKRWPVLVHCDLVVVDENLREIAPSFFKYQGLPSADKLNYPKFLIQNNVTGCASLINRELLELATPLPNDVMVHDWWFALVAKAQGSIGFVDRALIKYRQHGGNAIGAKCREKSNVAKNIFRLLVQAKHGFIHIRKSVKQAQHLQKLVSSPEENSIKEFVYFRQLSLSRQAQFTKQLANNASSLIERILIQIALIAYSSKPTRK
ncbi:glycosyltransferase family 2 protein [Pseudoalteromonas sp. YIC-656]|uniref:glycosyltransferase family 2 protein n=1 Tax=Pseudoalteromonas pernae TaxID=3118054 RepID=UPI0032427022